MVRSGTLRNFYPEVELERARDRLERVVVDGQEAYVLGKLYDLAIDVGTRCGRAEVPEDTSMTLERQAELASGTLMAFMEEHSDVSAARGLLLNVDFKQPREEVRATLRSTVADVASDYRAALREGIKRYKESSSNEFALDDPAKELELPFEEQVASWIQQLTYIQQENEHLGLLDHLAGSGELRKGEAQEALEEVKHAAAELEEKRKQLQAVRAQEASLALSTHFETLAKRERSLGTWLRILSGAGVIAAIVFTWSSGVSRDYTGSWTALAGHLAITALLAGGAAYAAKLASSHYTFGQWAKSIQVQLDSFEAYIGVMDEASARDRMREDFGRRVFGPPPPGSEESGPGITPAELFQFVSAVRRPPDS